MSKDLIVAAVVAVVAITGLVFFFGGSETGAYHTFKVARNDQQQVYVDYGNLVSNNYPGEITTNEWCSTGCQKECRTQFDSYGCMDLCKSQCNYDLKLVHSIYQKR